MNANTFRLIFSKRLGMCVPVAEQRSAQGKAASEKTAGRVLNLIVFSLTLLCAAPALALPVAPTVAHGSASFSQSGSTLTVTNTPNAIINWGSFSIGQNELTQFVQQSSASAVLNRVTGQSPSQILGQLQSNGRVFLINPNGIVFGQGARIDTAGLIASTLNLSDADFLAGKLKFSGTGSEGKVDNQGTINTAQGGFVYLIAPNVENRGLINAPNGDVLLAAGHSVEIADGLNPALRVVLTAPEGSVVNLGQVLAESGRIGLHGGMVANSGTVSASSAVAEGGKIYLRAKTVDLQGRIEANGGTRGGSIEANGEVLFQTGTVQADGSTGGEVKLSGDRILQAGTISTKGNQESGGTVNVEAVTALVQTVTGTIDVSGGTTGGQVVLSASDGQLFLSGSTSANGATGGAIHALGQDIVLAAATLDASGDNRGGEVLVGGDFQGNTPAIQNAQTVSVNSSTLIDVSAKLSGNGGKAIVWSDQETAFGGTIQARGGTQNGDGGFVEVSGKEQLGFGGLVDTGAPNGSAGTLLLDPKNITIDANAGGGASYAALADPNPATGDGYGGGQIVELSNGNIAVVSTGDDFGATDAGAVFLFNGSTGGLISALYGSSANDQIGKGGDNSAALGVVKLSNGNFVISSPDWDNGVTNGVAADVGAVTWASSSLGVSGVVSAANSLVGTTTGDRIGSAGVTALVGSGNYVVSSPFWDSTAVNVGSATLVNGSSAATGQISAASSLVGSTAEDRVGRGGATALTNGNYVVSSSAWNLGRGAATWRSGTDFSGGTVTFTNSLYGRLTNDLIGGGITALPNGNYLVSSSLWDYDDGSFLGAINAGAVTWVNGNNGNLATGSPGGQVSELNSLVGSSSGDDVGNPAPVVLANGNYVVSTSSWGRGDVGAVAWGDGVNGTFGFISSRNSVIGNSANDSAKLGSVLTNGNYVVVSTSWDSPTNIDVGAVTWVNGVDGKLVTGTVGGVISAANSLVGSHTDDRIGDFGILSLANGNYVVRSPSWDDGVSSNVGAATWGNGTIGTVGTVSSANSLVGATTGDQVGFIINALSNSNYIVRVSAWDNGGIVDAGAVTWVNGADGKLVTGTLGGVVSAANSLIGTTAGDSVGNSIIGLVGNGNYVVSSPAWDNGSIVNAGAVTWGDGAVGTIGLVSTANSLVGSSVNDFIGQGGMVALSNGNFVTLTPTWDNGSVVDAGAVTWGSGTAGITGIVSGANSLVGSSSGDQLGGFVSGGAVVALTDGNYVVKSFLWDNALTGVSDARAITWGNGSSGTSGTITSSNSLIGIAAADQLGSGGIKTLSNGRFIVSSPLWSGGEGRLHLGSASVGTGSVGGSTFGNDTNSNYVLTTTAITDVLDAGTNLTLQANNDITLSSAIIANNTSGNGGNLTLQAGRSILLNANITTDNGTLTLSANDASASSGNRDAGVANINVASGVVINTGTGALSAAIGNGVTGDTANVGSFTNAGTISIGSASSISSVFNNTGVFNITNGTLSLLAGGTNSGTFNLAGTGSIRLPFSGNAYPTFANAAAGTLNINTTTGGWSFVSDSGTQGGIVNNAGTININTAYTSWEAAFTNSSSGLLNIAAGNALSMQNGQTLQGSISLGAGSTLWVSERHGTNAWFNGTTISGTGTVQVAAGSGPVADFTNVSASAATLRVANGGTANILAGTTTFANLNMTGGTLTGDGTLNVNTALTQTGGTQSGNGNTVLGSSATTTLGAASISRALSNQGTLNLNQITLSGPLNNSGTLNVTTGTSSVAGAFTQSGILDVASGATFTKIGGFTNTGTISGKGTINVGSTGLLTNNGTLRPGASPGTLNITGNFTQGPSGTLFMELGGTSQGANYDWLNITGTANLGGTLQVALFGGFAPVAGNAFGLINAAGGVSGTFAQINTPAGYNFSSSYGANLFNLDLLSVTAPPTMNTVPNVLDSLLNLGAVSFETPLLYLAGQSSPTASSSGTLTQTAEILLPDLMPQAPAAGNSGDDAPNGSAVASLIPMFDQLVRDASFKDTPHDSRLICR